MDASTAAIVQGWNLAATPPPAFTVSEWADANRFLPEVSASRGSRWRTETTPYLRGIMDAIHEPGVTKIALMKGAQIGGSEALHNILGYLMQHEPCPILLIQPTMDVAEEWSKERLRDMLISTPILGAAIDGSLSTLTYKVFPGGFLALGGGNTANSFARYSVRVAMADDADRLPAVVGEEGDPADLLANRVTAWDDGLQIFVSTPILKHGRIDTLYQNSDQRRYLVPCPNCAHEDWVTWGDRKHFWVAFEDRNPETARLQCPVCDVGLYEPERRAMIAAGRWWPTTAPQSLGLVGFHLPSMLSTLSSVSLSGLVDKFLAANAKGRESLRVFINTTLAEGWEEHGTRMQPEVLRHRRESYGQGVEVPEAAAILTAGVDVQHNRFEVQVTAWGPGEERWVIDYQILDGDPKLAETQAALFELLNGRYAHALGPTIPIHATCLDTGYATEAMYDLVLARRVRRIWATKGQPGSIYEPMIGRSSDKRYGKQDRPVTLYPINTDKAKSDVYSSLALAAAGPGFVHFPLHVDRVDEEYFDQLCAEHRETRYNKQGVATNTVWVLDRERNEALDTAVLCLAAYQIFGGKKRYFEMSTAIRAAAATMATPEPPAPVETSPEAPPTVVTPVRMAVRPARIHRSKYLG